MNSVDDIDLIEETPAAAEASESASEDVLDHAAAAAVEAADPSDDDEEDGDEEDGDEETTASA
ncbi:ATPase, partial [Mesorhizobium sp. M1C.F.Ca.ET.204.01.1.1]